MNSPRINGTSALKPEERYTVAEYKLWNDNKRWELIHGVAFAMSPAPRRQHQKLAIDLGSRLLSFVGDKGCEIYLAPIDVYLPGPAQGEDDTVVQPDVLGVCDPSKLIDEGIRGAPDFIAEIISPSTADRDLTDKLALYELHGVREYWVVFPENGRVFVYRRQGEAFCKVSQYNADEPVDSSVFPGFSWAPRAGRLSL
ncbi:MAG: Uma2 family endonuclease [Rectinemataceae bacterium]